MSSGNMIYASPRIVDFEHVLADHNTPVAVRSPTGETGATIQRLEKQLTFGVAYMTLGGSVAGMLNHTFEKEDSDLCSIDTLMSNAGIDPLVVWETAFDVAKELFEITKDQPAGSEQVGIPFYLKLQKVKANLNPKGNMGVTFSVGIYRDSAKTNMVNMFEMTFVDKKQIAARAKTLESLQDQIEGLNEMIAGTHPNLTGKSDSEIAEYKASAEEEKPVVQAKIDNHNMALVGPLSTVLGLTEVKAAFGAITEAAFNEFKSKVDGWSNINVDTLMDYFPAALDQLLEA
jgi:hypothetical protein